MKKSFIGFLLSVLGLAWANAQSVDNYKFVSSTGTYTALSGGTALTQIPSDGSDVAAFVYDATTKVTVEKDDNPGKRTIAGIDMGFDFMLGGETFRKFAVTGYGYVLLGKADADIEFTAWDFYMNRLDGVSTAVGIGTDVPVYGLAVDYAVTGETGSHVLTVQFADIAYQAADAVDKMNYQIKFYESDNHVEMIFAGYKGIADFEGDRYNLGLVAGGKTHFRRAGSDWSASSYESSTTVWAWSVSEFPAGLTYTFALPDPCAIPDYKVTELELTSKSDEIVIDIYIDTVSGSAEGYLVIASTEPVTGDPDGLNFVKGQQALGGTVIAVGDLSEFDPNRTNPNRSKAHIYFTHSNLEPNTAYYYTVYLSNTKSCLARYTAPVSQNIATATTAPAELKIVSASLNEMKFSAEANELNEEIAILMTTGKGSDRNGNRVYTGNYANLPKDAKVGDTFETSYTLMGETFIDKTIVLYQGSASESITCPVTLENNRIYYFGAVSKGKDNGFFSTSAVNAEPYLSPAVLPFTDNFADNLSLAEDNPFIGGWAGTRNFAVSSSSRKTDGVISTMTAAPAEAVLTIPALDFPEDSNVLVNIAYSLEPYGYNSQRVDGDSICLEISTDGGKTFKTLKAVHKETDNMTLGKVILSDYLGVKQAVLRLRAVSANTATTFNVKVTSIKISTLPFCPEPGRAYAAENYGGTLALTWNAGENGETQWNISTAPEAAEGTGTVWSRPVLVEQKPYYLSGLGDREHYNVRVQAICGGGRTSGWVESTVQAGRVPSFTETFDRLEFEPDWYGEMEPQIPADWQTGYYYISSYSGPYTSWSGTHSSLLEYRQLEGITEGMTDYNGSLAYDMQNNYGYVDLLKTPVVELNPVESPQFAFDAAFGSWIDGKFEVMPEESRADTMAIAMWVCDSGRFNIADAPDKVWHVAELATWHTGKTVEIDLSEYVTEPKAVAVVIAIYMEPTAGTKTHMLYLDNIGIVNMLPMARSLRVAALSGTEATVKWVADPTVETWISKITGGTFATPLFFETSGNMQVFTGLEPENTYTVSVSHVYTVDGKIDTAEWQTIEFETPGLTCDEVTAVTVSDVTRKSAVLTWEGDAGDGYRVRYRPVTQPGATPMEYIYVEVEDNTYMLSGLSLETEYEGGVQSVCNKTAELESDFVAFENFLTLALTCFEPTEPRVRDLGTKTTKVSWEGTSDHYQVAWSLQGADTWTFGEVVTDTFYTIKGLDYDRPYTFKVRGVCAAGDSSEWSETRNFRTGSRPACADPVNLRVEALTQTSATLLWEAEEAEEGDIQNYILRHRTAAVQAWDSIEDVKGNTYAITGMAPKTAYVWAVMTVCTDERYSENWAQLRFETPDTTAMEDLADRAGLSVAAAQGQVYVMNPLSVRIDNIRIYSTAGRCLETYAIRSYDNVILTTAVNRRVAVVEVESAGHFYRFKVLLP